MSAGAARRGLSKAQMLALLILIAAGLFFGSILFILSRAH